MEVNVSHMASFGFLIFLRLMMEKIYILTRNCGIFFWQYIALYLDYMVLCNS